MKKSYKLLSGAMVTVLLASSTPVFANELEANELNNITENIVLVTSEENLLSPKGIELRVNRSIQVEGTFGMIKQDMPFDRFTRTSLDKVSTEFMMVCLGLNIRKLFKFYDAKSKNKFWIAPNDLQPETKKKPSAKRLSNKVNRKKLKKEADEPNPKG